MKATTKPVEVEYIQWTGDNLKEVLNFTGKHPRFNEWFSSLEEFEEYVKNDGKVFKLFHKKHHQKAKVGCFIVRNENGRNIVFTESEFHATYDIEPVNPWISVDGFSNLPSPNVHVWINTKELGVVKGVMIALGLFDSVDGSFSPDDITVMHWMYAYIPQAPEVMESE